MNVTPLLNSLTQIPDPTGTRGALNLARMSNARAALKADAASSAGSTSGTTSGTPSGTTPASGAGLANESVFLQLLVAQLKNQDPQNPADGTAFVTQLAQFTTLEQDTQSSQDLNQILALMQASSATSNQASSKQTAPRPSV